MSEWPVGVPTGRHSLSSDLDDDEQLEGSYRSWRQDRLGRVTIMTIVEHAKATIPDSVEVPRVGSLRYELGFPTHETSQKLFDEMDFQRAVQCYLWAYPAVSFESIRLTLQRDLSIGFSNLGIGR
jgi:hypothetical protein